MYWHRFRLLQRNYNFKCRCQKYIPTPSSAHKLYYKQSLCYFRSIIIKSPIAFRSSVCINYNIYIFLVLIKLYEIYVFQRYSIKFSATKLNFNHYVNFIKWGKRAICLLKWFQSFVKTLVQVKKYRNLYTSGLQLSCMILKQSYLVIFNIFHLHVKTGAFKVPFNNFSRN